MNVRFNTVCTLIAAAFVGCAAPNAGRPAPGGIPLASNFAAPRARDVRLFVSDYEAGAILVYSLPSLSLIKTISLVNQLPKGECSDNHGDVWVTNDVPQNAPRLTNEFNHDGVLINTLSDPFGFPGQGCAWDPTTGDLAVTNINFSCCSSNVLIYPGASGTPRQLGGEGIKFSYFLGYDSQGDLFFDGEDLNYQFTLSELPKGGQSAHDIDVSGGKIVFPGMVQSTDSATLYVGDIDCKHRQLSCLHRLSLNGSSAKITEEVDLHDSGGFPLCNMMQGVIWTGHFYGSSLQTCDTNSNATYIWRFPAGGKPQKGSSPQELQPYGAAISL
ncbi:MAG TPA: hypothetical protein VIW73_09945 [Candidatus Cybelea sp.]